MENCNPKYQHNELESANANNWDMDNATCKQIANIACDQTVRMLYLHLLCYCSDDSVVAVISIHDIRSEI